MAVQSVGSCEAVAAVLAERLPFAACVEAMLKMLKDPKYLSVSTMSVIDVRQGSAWPLRANFDGHLSDGPCRVQVLDEELLLSV